MPCDRVLTGRLAIITLSTSDRRPPLSGSFWVSAVTAVEPATHGAGSATRLILAASLGNALEFYEILVYGYFAVIISKVFFPAADEALSLLVTFGTFGASFLARPVGAIFLGAY